MRARSRFERATFNYHARVRVNALKLGLAGERAVGQFLEGLRVGGARIMASSQRKFDPERIAGRIVVLRGLRVLLDAELARLYGVQTRTLTEEWASLRSQIVILDKGRGRHSKFPPLAFTEHGAIMAATVLNSPRAVEMSVYVVHAFIKLRELLASNAVRWSGNLDACTTFRINDLL